MKKLRKFAALVMALMMFATLLAACGDNNLRLSLAVEGGVTSVAPGGSAKFTATVVEGETDSIVYSITAGSEHAGDDPEAHDNLRLAPALLLEMMRVPESVCMGRPLFCVILAFAAQMLYGLRGL